MRAPTQRRRRRRARAQQRAGPSRLRLVYELSDRPETVARANRAGGSEEDWVRRFMEEFDAEELPAESDVAAAQVVSDDTAASTRRPQEA